jgi:hypothetical protein
MTTLHWIVLSVTALNLAGLIWASRGARVIGRYNWRRH